MNKSLQGNLLKTAGVFLFLQAVILSLSPVVRERTWDATLLWKHWILLFVWGIFAIRIHRDSKKYLPDADPYLFPAAALLSGWGILSIWRLNEIFGARQTLWLAISMAIILVGMRVALLKFLQRYKYLLLLGGLSLTALTFLFGTNPSGVAPRLWLGCCGVYIQPSEPLKLVLIIYLAAYLSEKLPYRLKMIHIFFPTLILGGIVVLLLLVQRDLGTASIFLAIYATTIYLTTNRKRVLLVSILSIIIVGFAGYYLVEIVNARISSWLNPWVDSGGSSYQVIQALIAMGNGGIEGRGLGLGFPWLVPVAISDFISTAIAEETGLIGTIGLLATFGIIITRGLRIALRASDLFKRLLAASISIYIGVQTILIIGGNLRLLPLTGVTLPFVSYGGSSLLTSFIALLFLLLISNHMDEEPAALEQPAPYIVLNTILLVGLFVSALGSGWWAVVRGPDLQTRRDNPRRVIEEQYVLRGAILGRLNSIITRTTGEIGSYARQYIYTELSPITGYSNYTYGQAGLEASLDGYLRGLEGTPAINIWRDHLLYGMSPTGLDVRLSIDLNLQRQADEMMREQSGAVILLNAQSGEILVMSSNPAYDPNDLHEIAGDLLNDPGKPLINRAASGLYPTGTGLEPFATALNIDTTSGPGQLGQVTDIFNKFNFNNPPNLRLETAPSFIDEDQRQIYTSPLQMALASSVLSNDGNIPAPRIATAVNTPKNGWVSLPALGTPVEVMQPSAVTDTVNSFITDGENFWSHTWQAMDGELEVTWFIGGTPLNWQSAPLVVVVVLEKNDPNLAQRVGSSLLAKAMNP